MNEDSKGFNLSMGIMSEIQNLLSISSQHFLNCKMDKWFWTLRAIKNRVIYCLDDKERKVLKELELNCFKAMKDYNQTPSTEYAAKFNMEIEKFNEFIMDLLNQHGFIGIHDGDML